MNGNVNLESIETLCLTPWINIILVMPFQTGFNILQLNFSNKHDNKRSVFHKLNYSLWTVAIHLLLIFCFQTIGISNHCNFAFASQNQSKNNNIYFLNACEFPFLRNFYPTNTFQQNCLLKTGYGIATTRKHCKLSFIYQYNHNYFIPLSFILRTIRLVLLYVPS